MYASHQPLNDEHHYEEGEIEIADLNDEEDKPERGVRRSRSMGSRRGGPNVRKTRSSSGDSVSSQSSRRSMASSRSRDRSSSVGRMSHRQRSRAMMASPSKYGRGLRRGDSDVHSTATTVADDLSDEPSPSLPEGDNDSNHQLRKRLNEMSEMATKSPSVYRQRKQKLKQRLSSENPESLTESITNLTMSPCQSTGKKVESTGMPRLDPQEDYSGLDTTPSVHSESINRQQRKEQAALEEVMSMMKSNKNHRSSDTTQSRSSRKSGTTNAKPPIRRTQSLNVGAPTSSHKPSRRSLRTSESKKERRNMVKSNLGKFVEDD